ncbi:GNAT family N-acetyltransferase [Deinococcus humi]|uniref:L-amino acid N-acyltransferase YncA n=1 Tax=Deinococcus humi TaxID=662880 RepID=A0A7W8NF50_9DEIO|nr:GNAT family N-acetyltransferase [Deinococcus humi]MBB5365024.1 L-amino acid N-acyltransferase YncA [Deinococcus humi]GGO34795.1 N-acetyltransferase [Deinococcus humi]
MTPPPPVRPACRADAPAIARIHVSSWRETYAGLMPDDFLERMTSEEMRRRREANWERTISQGLETVLVAEQDGVVVAFTSAGPARDHPGYEAELMTLYALRSAQGQGLGQALFRQLVQDLRADGVQNLALWVLADNPTRQWYLRRGGREAGEKLDGTLREVRVVWDRLPG